LRGGREKSEDEHGEKRLKTTPKGRRWRSVCSDFDVAPDEEIKKFAVSPKFGEAKIERPRGGAIASDEWDASGAAQGRSRQWPAKKAPTP